MATGNNTSPSSTLSEPVAADTARRSHGPLAGAGAVDSEHTQRLITLGTIAGLIAHEFNNILTPVVSYSQMALSSPNDQELSTKALQRALAGSERAAQIAQVILGFVRDEQRSSTGNAGPAQTAPSSGVRATLDAALVCMARTPDKDGIRLSIDVPADQHVRIRPVALQHVLLNLILNARNALQPGGELSITSHARSTPAPGREAEPVDNAIEIVIVDTGKGMNAEQLENLFMPFQTNSDHSPVMSGEPYRGTGLGMTICKRLIEDAGGYIAVRSAPNQGTTVRIVLPRAEPLTPAAPAR